MSFEAIKSIAEVENRAEQIKADAVKDAKDLIAAAGKAKDALQDAAFKAAEATNKEALNEAKKLGEKDAAELVSKDQAALANLRRNAEAKLEEAATLIVERIVNG